MKKTFIFTLILLVLLLAGIYVGGIYAGHNYFLPHTYVNGVDVGYKQADEIADALVPHDTSLTIYGRGSEETIDMADFGYKNTLDKSADMLIRDQDQFAWPRTLFQDTVINDAYTISYNEQGLENTVDKLQMLQPSNFSEPKDAVFTRGEDGHYTIIPEDDGNMPYPEKVYAAIKEAVDAGLHEVHVDSDEFYHKAAVRRDDPELVEKLELVQSLKEQEIRVNMIGAEEVLDTFALLDMTYKDEDGNIVVIEEKLDEYIQYLEDTYEDFKQAQPFYTHDGRRIMVGGNVDDGIGYAMDTYGFLLDNDSTWVVIRNAIQSGESQTVDAVWLNEAWDRNTRNGNIGDTYIEISIDEQHMWAFWDGELLIDDDIVTGLYADPAKRSPTGLFRIWDKSSPATLSGEMAGEAWESHVDFWMGITWTGVGLHNAPWRSAFGGDIYMWNGSHGCLNFTYDTAEVLYTTYGFGAPVIIY